MDDFKDLKNREFLPDRFPSHLDRAWGKAGRMAKSQTRYRQRLQHGVRPCGLDTDSAVHVVAGSTTRVFFPSHRSFLLVDKYTFLVETASLIDDVPVQDAQILREQR